MKSDCLCLLVFALLDCFIIHFSRVGLLCVGCHNMRDVCLYASMGYQLSFYYAAVIVPVRGSSSPDYRRVLIFTAVEAPVRRDGDPGGVLQPTCSCNVCLS